MLVSSIVGPAPSPGRATWIVGDPAVLNFSPAVPIVASVRHHFENTSSEWSHFVITLAILVDAQSEVQEHSGEAHEAIGGRDECS